MTRVLLAGPDDAELGHQIELWGHVVLDSAFTRPQLGELLGRHRQTAEMLVTQAHAPWCDQQLVDECAASGITVVAISRSAEENARARAWGALVVRDTDRYEELPELLLGPLIGVSGSGIPVEAPGLARVVALWGAPGSPGTTSLALNIAAEAQAGGIGRVCVVDADSWSPAVTAFWGIVSETPALAAAARLAEQGSWTETEFARLAELRASGVWVLGGLTALERWPELSSARIQQVLAGIRQWCDLVVVDVGSRLDAAEDAIRDPLAPQRSACARAVVAEADLVLGVGAGDPVSLARLVRAWPDWAALVGSEMRLVVNRLRARTLGVQPHAQVQQLCERFLGVRPMALLPEDQRVADTALARAVPFAQVSASSVLRKGVAALTVLIDEQLGARQAAPVA